MNSSEIRRMTRSVRAALRKPWIAAGCAALLLTVLTACTPDAEVVEPEEPVPVVVPVETPVEAPPDEPGAERGAAVPPSTTDVPPAPAPAPISPPAIVVLGNSTRIAAGDDTPNRLDHTDFGSIPQGGFALHSFRIMNAGSAVLLLESVEVPQGFQSGPLAVRELMPGTSTTLNLWLDNTLPGTSSGTVRIASNAAPHALFEFSVRGTITPPVPAIVLSGGAIRIANGDASPAPFDRTDFGSVDLGAPPVDHVFTILNEGTAPLTLGAITVPAGFVVVEEPAATVAPGGNTTFRVRLDTNDGGSHAGSLHIPHNAPGTTFTFAIRGQVRVRAPATGPIRATADPPVAPAAPVPPPPPPPPPPILPPLRMAVLGNERNIGNSDFQPTPDDHTDFGEVAQGQSVVRTFTIRNTGSDPLTLNLLRVPDGFLVIQPPAGTLPAGESTTLVLQLDGAGQGTQRGIVLLSVHDPATSRNSFEFSVVGMVRAPTPRLTVLSAGGTPVPPVAAPDARYGTTFAFELALGAEPANLRFVLQNDGQLPLTIGAIVLPAGVTVGQRPDTAIAPGASAPLVLHIDSSTLRSIAGSIIVYHNGEMPEPFVFQIRGTAGVPPAPQYFPLATEYPYLVLVGNSRDIARGDDSPDLIDHTDFGKLVPGQLQVREFTIRNSGADPLSITDVELPPGFELVQPYSRSIPPGSTATLQIRIDTSEVGTRSGEIRIVSNDPRPGPFVFAVQGVVADPAPAFTLLGADRVIAPGAAQANLNDHTHFGSIAQGSDTGVRTFTIRNDGAVSLVLGDIRMPEGFALAIAPESAVPPGTTTTFVVRLDSSNPGLRTGTIEIDSNDPERSPFRFVVQGLVTVAR